MKKVISAVLVLVTLFMLASCGKKAEESVTEEVTKKANTDNILVIYYADNECISKAAEFISENTGADLIAVTPKKAYPTETEAFEKQIKAEHASKARPEVNASKGDPSDYDIIFIGYPLWDKTAPMPLFTYLEKHKMKDKALLTFTIGADGKSGESLQDIADTYPYCQITDKFVFKTEDFDGWQAAFDGWFSKALYW